MIKNYLKKAITIGITTISLMTMSPIYAHASYATYDSNNNVLYNYTFNYNQCLDGQGNKVRNKWIRNWNYDDKSKCVLRNAWYYFDSNGFMAVGWEKINGKWYYFSENNDSDGLGIMYQNCMTQDGYWVGNDGAWVQ